MDLLRVPCHISVTNMQVLIIIKLNIECLVYVNIFLNLFIINTATIIFILVIYH